MINDECFFFTTILLIRCHFRIGIRFDEFLFQEIHAQADERDVFANLIRLNTGIQMIAVASGHNSSSYVTASYKYLKISTAEIIMFKWKSHAKNVIQTTRSILLFHLSSTTISSSIIQLPMHRHIVTDCDT